jgi:hypothetical protein
MKHFPSLALVPVAAFLATLACSQGADDAGKAAPQTELVIRDGAGKEQKLKAWKFTQGTRHLTWLAPPGKEPEKKGDAPPGPEALEFREENSTTFANGILTLIPLDRIRSVEYNHEKDLVSVRVAGEKADSDETLTGSTRFRVINKIAIDAEVDKGSLGVAEVKFLGGMGKGIKGITFPAPKSAPAPMGRPAAVVVVDKEKRTDMAVTDLRALYHFTVGGEKLSPLLHFKKTLKVDVGQIKKLARTENEEGGEIVWQVTLKDSEETLTLLQMVTLDGKDAQLVGLVGLVPAGYKLFPPHVIGSIEFDPAKEPAKEPEKDQEPAKKPGADQ